MEPELRILDHGTIAVVIRGLPKSQQTAIHEIVRAPDRDSAVSVSFSSPHEYVFASRPEYLKQFFASAPIEREPLGSTLKKVETLLDNYLRKDYKIVCKGTILDLSARTHIMGIVNVTPDSFSDGGQCLDPNKAVAHAQKIAAQGADIIDIGGESTRPGAESVSVEHELARIIPVITRITGELPTPISVDTYKSAVAEKAIQAGASIVNDISGLRFSPDMARVVAEHGAAVVIMHIKGTPRDMQHNPVYADVVGEIKTYLEESIERALNAGVAEEQILIDPGIGFGKTREHNLEILNRLGEFRVLGRPIVVGTSRKKFIGAILNLPQPEQRIEGTAATVALGIERGACVMRVHDVAQMVRVARMTDAILGQR